MKVPMRRYGGKVYLSKWILEHIPEHDTYIEPFAGSAAVLFAKDPSQTEILNDIDGKITTVFEMIKSRPYELAAMLWATPYSQSNWRDVASKSDIEKAALYIAASQQFYASATHSSTFSVDSGHANKNKAKVWADWFQRILPAAARLKDVQILNQDALEVIKRFREKLRCVWYVDPPYFGHEKEYSDSVKFDLLAEELSAVKGTVLVSGTTAEAKFFPEYKVEMKDYVSRAATGRHKQTTKRYQECLYIRPGQ
jgi:DNA adenine methylase